MNCQLKSFSFAIGMILASVVSLSAQNNVIDEVVWVVGDEPIYKSEVETQIKQMQYEGQKINGDPYCVIPEMMAVQKLYLHQAKLDTITVNESMVFQRVDAQLNFFIDQLGSKEKVEEYFRKPMTSIREELADFVRNNSIVQEVQRTLVERCKSNACRST